MKFTAPVMFPMEPGVYRVSFEGNGYSNRATVESYLLYRAAELTVRDGYDWFVLQNRDSDSQWDPKYGQTGLTSTAIVRMFKGQRPPNVGHDAAAIMKTMGPSIRR